MIYAGGRDANKELLKPLLEEFFLFAKSVDKEFLTW